MVSSQKVVSHPSFGQNHCSIYICTLIYLVFPRNPLSTIIIPILEMRKSQPTENNKHVQDSTPSARLRLEFNPSLSDSKFNDTSQCDVKLFRPSLTQSLPSLLLKGCPAFPESLCSWTKIMG